MLQWVVLHHTLLDGSSHYDWLLEPAADAPLLSLRAPAPLGAGDFSVERLADHRRIYLSFEGDIGAGRGSVKRIQQGTLLDITASPTAINARLHDGCAIWHLVATQHRAHVVQAQSFAPSRHGPLA